MPYGDWLDFLRSQGLEELNEPGMEQMEPSKATDCLGWFGFGMVSWWVGLVWLSGWWVVLIGLVWFVGGLAQL